MAKTVFTTITPLPAGVSRETVLETLHDHLEMIDLNPAHSSRERIVSPPEATPEEYHCTWYQITDEISYFPGYKGKVHFNAVFHDLANGLQTHVYAPMGLVIRERWTIGGNAPGEPVQPTELGIGAPVSGLYLREDVDMKCNFIMRGFVRKQLKEALATLVARLLVKSQLQTAVENNKRLTSASYSSHGSPPNSPPLTSLPMSPPLSGGLDMSFPKPYQHTQSYQPTQPQRFSQQTYASEIDGKQKHEYLPKPPKGPVELP